MHRGHPPGAMLAPEAAIMLQQMQFRSFEARVRAVRAPAVAVLRPNEHLPARSSCPFGHRSGAGSTLPLRVRRSVIARS
jgi:hypothetical protein